MKTIIHDDTHVALRGEALDAVLWQGRQWSVTSYEIERRDGTYPIEAWRLAESNRVAGEPDWPRHLATKEWVDLPDFITAFVIAVALHGARVRPDALQRSIENGMQTAERVAAGEPVA